MSARSGFASACQHVGTLVERLLSSARVLAILDLRAAIAGDEACDFAEAIFVVLPQLGEGRN
jgi:hypothetical protein